MLFAALSALSLASTAAAQASVQIVQVGATASSQGGVFQFIPPSVNAANGTVVSFQFTGVPGNHTVTQSSFADPCDPLTGGFDSGWVQILSPVMEVPEFNVTITDDSKPIWFYCKQLLPSPHCSAGMVGAINAPATGNTFSAFQNAARSFRGAPGQGVGNLVGVGASASAPVGPIPSGVTTFGAPTSNAATTTSTNSATATGTSSATTSTGTDSAASSSAAIPSATAVPTIGTDSAAGSTATSPASGTTSPSPTSAAASHGVASSVVALLAAALGFAMV